MKIFIRVLLLIGVFFLNYTVAQASLQKESSQDLHQVAPEVLVPPSSSLPSSSPPMGDPETKSLLSPSLSSSTLTPETINLLALFFANFAYYPHTFNNEILMKLAYQGTGEPDSTQIVTEGFVGGDTVEGVKNLNLLKSFAVKVMPYKYPKKTATEGCVAPPKFITEYLSPDYTDLSHWKVRLIEGENGINFGIKYTKWTISAVVAYHPEKNILVIGIRGTDPARKEDLITDSAPIGRAVKDIHPLMYMVPASARVPRGFLGYFESMGDDIFNAIKDLIPDEKEATTQIIITGHSLGGAAANIAAAFVSSMSEIYPMRTQLARLSIIDNPHDVPEFTLSNIHLRTFGMPANVGNQEYIDWMESELKLDIIHFSNPRDPITHVTTGGSYLGYFVPKWVKGQYNQGYSKKWVNLKSTEEDALTGDPLAPHGLDRYAQAIIEQDPAYEMQRLELGKVVSPK